MPCHNLSAVSFAYDWNTCVSLEGMHINMIPLHYHYFHVFYNVNNVNRRWACACRTG